MFSRLVLMVLILMIPAVLFSQITINDAFINAGESKNLTANNTYLLDGLVYVESGATLTIQAGTVIKAKESPTTGDNTSALIIARGGKIMANGTATQPIIFTAESDDLNDPFDLTYSDRNLWGGVILLGYAGINTTSGVGQIEGISSTEPRGQYGGGLSPNDDDNSGVMRYVSIRHGGSEIGAGNEINGLTFGAVGRGTTIEHIEVYANYDDGYEWFGGTVNTKYLVSAFCADDGFDYDEGFRGKGQFWFAIQATDFAGRVGEHDGGTTPENGTPYAIPILSNCTYIGPGTGAFPQGDGAECVIFRDNAGGKYYNTIFTEYNGALGGAGITVEDLASGEDSRARLEAGDLVLQNNIWWQFGNGNTLADIAPQTWVANSLAGYSNQISNPQLINVSRANDGNLDPRPNASGPAASGATVPNDPFFTQVNYYGAFDPNAPAWTDGWTALHQEGITHKVLTVTDGFINAGESKTLTANNTYVLDGLVYVESGATLKIEPGTVIKGKQTPSTGDNTSALIITRGGKIMAEGTAERPIIFTAESDNLSDPFDLTYTDRNLWGGVILLGYASINTTSGVGQIEGISSTEPRGQYGGGSTPDDNDNSGVMRYVSIRHGGSEIGAGNEINGLTFGAVGRGTTIEHIEVFANYDDGYEWFGGTVNTKYLISAFCADDGFDYDEGFRGKGQFWFAIQSTDFAGRVGEHDGGTTPENGMPYAIPILSNCTYIGPGVNAFPQGDGAECVIFRDNAGGKYYNTIFTEYNGALGGSGITIEDLSSGEDSRQRLEAGDLLLNNNIWWQFGNGNTLADLAPQTWVADSLAANSNQIVDPQLNNIVRSNTGGLDPRPSASGPAASGAVVPNDPFFTQVNYYGAFDPNAIPWFRGWTALDGEYITEIKDRKISNGSIPQDFSLRQNYPNPFNPTTTIEYDVAAQSHVTLTIFNALGQKVATLVNDEVPAGEYRITWDASNVSSGIYFYQLKSGSTVLTKKMVLMR